ncbi:MAG TPA: isopentenyl phosphate kinase, partial [Thermoanaerobaculia bacterium]|nr:isopentenyl phosphate kinase [Thermoanaerobaculia bacterium]
LLKLGGSLITDKERPDTARREVIRRLAGEIAGALRGPGALRLVLGHGSGSFGHTAAARLRLGAESQGEGGPEGVSRVQERAAALHRQVLDALLAEGASPFSVAPSSVLVAAGGLPVRCEAEPLLLALEGGLLPVVYGDVVMDRERGYAIASTEAVFLALAEELGRHGVRIARALWAGATDGVLGRGGERLEEVRADAAEAALAAAGGAAGTDVTGGMRHRLEAALELARRGVPSLVFDGGVPGRLAAALRGELAPGTRVVPGSGYRRAVR